MGTTLAIIRRSGKQQFHKDINQFTFIRERFQNVINRHWNNITLFKLSFLLPFLVLGIFFYITSNIDKAIIKYVSNLFLVTYL